MTGSENEPVKQAAKLLEEELKMAAALIRDQEVKQARQKLASLFGTELEEAGRGKLVRGYALCTFQDSDLSLDEQIDGAFKNFLEKRFPGWSKDKEIKALIKALQRSKNISKARKILNGKIEWPSKKLFWLAKKLRNTQDFRYARKLLGLARQSNDIEESLRLELAQQHAFCTYKDPDLPFKGRVDRALDILQNGANLAKTEDPETLGLAGVIFKLKWLQDGQKQHLEQSLAYYMQGYKASLKETDNDGYTGINTAFILDALASQELKEARPHNSLAQVAQERRKKACDIRQELVKRLLKRAEQETKLEKKRWFLVTLVEAYFGLGQFDEAYCWLEKAIKLLDVPKREYAPTARQLAFLAYLTRKNTGPIPETANSPADGLPCPDQPSPKPVLVDNDLSQAGDVASDGPEASRKPGQFSADEILHLLMGSGDFDFAVRSAFMGKVGLALSGGGFRASLFHIGVLARLAELDLLRMVEVLSCVSGGSIIGAHYYLEVRHLLQTKEDSQITREDYIELVKKVADNFLAGVQQNIRMQAAANPWANLKVIFSSTYTRTRRLGELFEKKIFSKVEDGKGNQSRWLNNLYVSPLGEENDFAPKYDNWRRNAKVPILILNATTLNTGHNWQFTASFMGEPPGRMNSEIDSNCRLRRLYYGEAPKKHRKIRLGEAVAASACVPGLFDPLMLKGLYQKDDEDIAVNLVDGGVHDNQGVMGLLEQDCTFLLVSDASGQMETKREFRGEFLDIPLRANDILMKRVREAQYEDLETRLHSSTLRGLILVHLKKELGEGLANWINCQEPADEDWSQALAFKISPETSAPRPVKPFNYTNYGIRKDIQQYLAAVRTDLDTFSDAEAYALMSSGYRMAEYELRNFKPLKSRSNHQEKWRFLAFEQKMEENPKEYKVLLDTAHHRSFRIFRIWWRLQRWLFIVGLVSLGMILLVLPRIVPDFSELLFRPVLTPYTPNLVIWIGAGLLGGLLISWLRKHKTLNQSFGNIFWGSAGFLAALIQLYILDKVYLARGCIKPEEEH